MLAVTSSAGATLQRANRRRQLGRHQQPYVSGSGLGNRTPGRPHRRHPGERRHGLTCAVPPAGSTAGASTTTASSATGHRLGDDNSALGAGTSAGEVSTGSDHACALTSGGTVWCWGTNDSGELGHDGRCGNRSSEPGRGLAGGTAARRRSPWRRRLPRLRSSLDSIIDCWGNNSDGQIGDNQRPARPDPVRMSAALSAATQRAERRYPARLRRLWQTTPYCWGDNFRPARHRQDRPQRGSDLGRRYRGRHRPELRFATRLCHPHRRHGLVLGPEPVRPARERKHDRQLGSGAGQRHHRRHAGERRRGSHLRARLGRQGLVLGRRRRR